MSCTSMYETVLLLSMTNNARSALSRDSTMIRRKVVSPILDFVHGESPDKANHVFIIMKAGRSEQVQLGHRRPPQPPEVGWDDLYGGAGDTNPK
jgi:hypothetical protein